MPASPPYSNANGPSFICGAVSQLPGWLSVLQGLAIDAAGILGFGFLVKRDLAARDRQLARLSRSGTASYCWPTVSMMAVFGDVGSATMQADLLLQLNSFVKRTQGWL